MLPITAAVSNKKRKRTTDHHYLLHTQQQMDNSEDTDDTKSNVIATRQTIGIAQTGGVVTGIDYIDFEESETLAEPNSLASFQQDYAPDFERDCLEEKHGEGLEEEEDYAEFDDAEEEEEETGFELDKISKEGVEDDATIAKLQVRISNAYGNSV